MSIKNSEQFLEGVYQNLIAEVLGDKEKASPAEQTGVSVYYRNVWHNPALRPFFCHNWISRTRPMVELLAKMPAKNTPYQILDAGCGAGTESYTWAMTRPDIAVTGIDASAERIQIAQKRVPHFAQQSHHPCQVQFANDDVFDVLAEKPFDLVWVMEALSHIDPAERFVKAAHKALSENGYLVVSDSHLLNPMMAWRIWKIRRKNSQWRTEKVVKGKTISYADERLFTIGQLTKLLESEGFRVVQSHFCIFFPPQFAKNPILFRLATVWDKLLGKIPLVRRLGGIFTVVAQKQQG
jgi:2-polyprenyl-3-methyl-5-hydroxy-6-metoxy-1,4-benzoquinol methylase